MTKKELKNYMEEKNILYRCWEEAVQNADWENADMYSQMISNIDEILEEEKITIWEEF